MTRQAPVALLGKESVDTSVRGARAWRIWCRGTTGLGDSACPSAQPDPARELALYFTPDSTAQIDYGVPDLTDTIARVSRLKGAVLKPKPDNFQEWKSAIVAASAANRKPVAPVLVCIDSFDGGIVDVREYLHDDHFSLPQSCIGEARDWLTKLLD